MRKSQVAVMAAATFMAGGLLQGSAMASPSNDAHDAAVAFNQELAEALGDERLNTLASASAQGRQLDSATGASPTRVVQRDSEDAWRTVSYYPDGSYSFVSVEKPTTVQTAATLEEAEQLAAETAGTVGACSQVNVFSGGRVFRDCTVAGGESRVTMTYRADYTILNGAYDQINRVYNGSAEGRAGQTTTYTPAVTRGTETIQNNANARGTTNWRLVGGAANEEFNLVLRVGRDQATAAFS